MQTLGSALERVVRRLLRGTTAPSLEYMYEANHIQGTFHVDFETFRKDPAAYLFRLPPEIQALWERQHVLLPQQLAAVRTCEGSNGDDAPPGITPTNPSQERAESQSRLQLRRGSRR